MSYNLSNSKFSLRPATRNICIYILAIVVAPIFLNGATHYVTSDEETPAPGPGTLRYEIENAASGDSIVINSTVTYIDMDGFVGIEISSKDLTIIGHNNFTINCSSAFYIFQIANSSVKIENIVLKNAKNFGAIFGLYSDIEIVNCEILDNNSDLYGGGIYLNTGNLTLRDCILSGNQGATGGGILFQGTQLKIIDSKILNNTIHKTNGSGGGIFMSKGTLTLTNSEILSNVAKRRGGGIYSNSDCIVNNSRINNNSTEENGGGIYMYDGKLELKDQSQVNGNTAKIDGGGIYLYSSASTQFEALNSSINNNKSLNYGGGGIHIRPNGHTKVLTNCEVNGNEANTEGGGIYNQGNLELDNVDMNNNTAKHGGGLYVYSGSATIDNSQVNDNNASTDGGGIYSRTKLDIKNNTSINNNSAGQTGGGLWMSHGGQSSTISSSNVNNNKALRAAGILIGDGTLAIRMGSNINNNENTGSFDGAGIYNANAELTINQSSIKNNNTPANGGGIFIANGSNASLATDQADISENTASGNGGGVYINTTATVINSTINENTATGPGGGMYVAELPSAQLNIENSNINENTASHGGGVILYSNNNSNSIINSEFKNNTSSNQGGGVWIKANTTISGTTFENNEANTQGGGIFMDLGTSTISNSSFSLNNGNNGGGLFILRGTLNIESTTIENNESTDEGGGIYLSSGSLNISNQSKLNENNTVNESGGGIYNQNGDLSIVSSELMENTSDHNGGGIFNQGTLELDDATVSQNQGYLGGGVYNNTPGNVTIKNNSTFTNNTASRHGGAIYSISSLEIDNSIINNNNATWDGGGMYSKYQVTIKNNSTFNNNTSSQTGGGLWLSHSSQTSTISGSEINNNNALRAAGILIQEGTLNIVQGSKVNGNENTGNYDGGGIYNENANLSIDNSSIENNKAPGSGGGIFIRNSAGASLSLQDATISGNEAGGSGGGVYSNNDLTINNSNFENNSAENNDGGGLLAQTGNVTIQNNSQFKSNEAAQFGGGIFLSAGTHIIQNTVVLKNKSGNSGGGIFFNEQSLTIENSKINDNISTGSKGGGIHNEKGALTIKESEINNNSAFSWGGGIYSSYLAGAISFSITDSEINGNSANNGGGISVDVINNYSIENCEFIGNNVSNNGGGINIIGGNGMVDIDNTTIKNNSARSGGGIYNSSMDLVITNSEFNNNSTSHNGGAIYNIDNKTTITGTEINNNNSDYNGGGIWNDGTLIVSQSQLLDNQSKYWGGGIHSIKTAELQEVIIEGNSSDDGGGIANLGDLEIEYSTITNNTSDNGGGIQNETYQSYSGDVTIHNSIVALNNASNGPDINNLATINGNHNLLTNYDNSGLMPGGTNNLTGDPLFASNFSNLNLTECSPAIDAASNGDDMGAVQSGQTAIVPDILTSSITVALDDTNPDSVSITPSMVDYDFGSCTDISIELSPNTFNCSHVGQSNTTTATVTYSGGQTFQETINVVVNDELAPYFTTLPVDTIFASASLAFPTPDPVEYKDGCEGNVTLNIYVSPPSSLACGEKYIRTYEITDLYGNTASYNQTIIIGNEMGPVITILDDETIDVSEINFAPDYRVTHDTSFYTSTNDELIREYCGESKKIRRIYTAIDACQNTTVATKEITFTDHSSPELISVAPFLEGVQNGDTLHMVDCIFPNATQSDISWTDNSSKATAKTNIYSNELPNHSPFGMYKLLNYNYTVEDECGNEAELDFHLGLYDLAGPVFQFFPQDTTISSAESLPSVDQDVIVLDICNYVIWDTVITSPVINPFTLDTTAFSRKWIARDIVGHETFREQMIFIKDKESQYATITSRITYHNDTIPERFDGEIGKNGIKFNLFHLDTTSGTAIKVDSTFSQNWFGEMGKTYFTSIVPGTYQVKVEVPEEYAISPDTLFNLQGWSDTLELASDSTLDLGLLILKPLEEFIPADSTHIFPSGETVKMGTSTQKTFSWTLSPNPSDGRINLDLPDESNYNFKLIDGTGKIIQSGEVSNLQTLHLNNIYDGVYYLQLMRNEEIIGYKKLIIME